MDLFVVGKVSEDSTHTWQMHGVFSSEELAISECITSEYFIGPVILDKPFPHETCEWEGAYYPMAVENANS